MTRILLLLSLLLSTGDDTVAELRERLAGHLEAEEWKKAASMARKIQIHGGQDEQKEMKEQLFYIRGRQELQKLTADKASPRKRLPQVRKFLSKYGEHEKLKDLGGALEKEIKTHIYDTLDDFEGKLRSSTLLAVTDPKLVKEGKMAARWRGSKDGFIHSPGKDWSRYTHLVFWVYSERPTSLVLQPMTDVHDNFDLRLPIPAGVWTEARIPIGEKARKWRPMGRPDWTSIGALRLARQRGASVNIILDDVRLERKKDKKS